MSSDDQVDANTMAIISAADATKMRDLQQQRKGKRTSATRTINNLQTNISTLSSAIATEKKLRDLLDKLNAFDSSIQNLILGSPNYSEAKYLAEVDVCEDYTDNLNVAIAQTELKLVNLRAASGQTQPISVGGANNAAGFSTQMNVQKVELPKFDGLKIHYPRFILEFNDIISKTSFTEYQKFNLLCQNVDEQSAALLRSNGMHKMTYADGKALLDLANGKDNALEFAVVDGLMNLKFDANKPFLWLSEAKSLNEVMNFHKMTAESFALYFVWRSLPPYFQDNLINLSNKNQPSLMDVLGNKFFDATTRTEYTRTRAQAAPLHTVAMATTGSDKKATGKTNKPN